MTNYEAKAALAHATGLLRRFCDIVEGMNFPDTLSADAEEGVRELSEEVGRFLADVAPGIGSLDSPQGLTVAEVLQRAGPPDKDGNRTITVTWS